MKNMGKRNLPRILIVEDYQTFRETVLEVLRDVGYKVRGARDFTRATKRLTRHHFDLVVSDMDIGEDHSGFDVLQLAAEKRPNAKIVMMSARADAALVEQAKASGAAQFLPKPFKVKDLLALIENLLEPLDAEDENDDSDSDERTRDDD
jgi:DNA-binding NtrC family response regulator